MMDYAGYQYFIGSTEELIQQALVDGRIREEWLRQAMPGIEAWCACHELGIGGFVGRVVVQVNMGRPFRMAVREIKRSARCG